MQSKTQILILVICLTSMVSMIDAATVITVIEKPDLIPLPSVIYYNETTLDTVQDFMNHLEPCPWFSDTASNACSSNARYTTIEAEKVGLYLGEITIVDSDPDRIKQSMMCGHRVNTFTHNDTQYFTVNLHKGDDRVVTSYELLTILNDLVGLERLGTKDYRAPTI